MYLLCNTPPDIDIHTTNNTLHMTNSASPSSGWVREYDLHLVTVCGGEGDQWGRSAQPGESSVRSGDQPVNTSSSLQLSDTALRYYIYHSD